MTARFKTFVNGTAFGETDATQLQANGVVQVDTIQEASALTGVNAIYVTSENQFYVRNSTGWAKLALQNHTHNYLPSPGTQTTTAINYNLKTNMRNEAIKGFKNITISATAPTTDLVIGDLWFKV